MIDKVLNICENLTVEVVYRKKNSEVRELRGFFRFPAYEKHVEFVEFDHPQTKGTEYRKLLKDGILMIHIVKYDYTIITDTKQKSGIIMGKK